MLPCVLEIYGESFVDQLVAMKSIGGSLTALDLSEYRYCFGPMVSLSSLASVQCPHLSRLNLSHTKTPVAHFMQLIAGCGKLVELVLSHCSWLNDEALAVVFRSCALLSKLDVAHCYQLTGACFEHASDCLNTLRIDYCDKVVVLSSLCYEKCYVSSMLCPLKSDYHGQHKKCFEKYRYKRKLFSLYQPHR